MKGYGLKIQERRKAVKLLKHIYNELHPLVHIDEISTEQEVAEISSDEEGPPAKKLNINDNSIEKSSNIEESDDELPCSQDRYKFDVNIEYSLFLIYICVCVCNNIVMSVLQ